MSEDDDKVAVLRDAAATAAGVTARALLWLEKQQPLVDAAIAYCTDDAVDDSAELDAAVEKYLHWMKTRSS